MPSSAPLVRVYVDALQGRAIYVHGALPCVSHFGFEPFRKKGLTKSATLAPARTSLVAKLWFARPAHAELVALRCGQDFNATGAMRDNGWVNLPPGEVLEKVKNVAALLGAKWQTQGAIERDAEQVVADIVRRVKEARMDGEMKQVNAEYRRYRLAQIEQGEPAIPYSAHIANFTRSLVICAAEKSMMAGG
jgi:hypothetical protein